jgi:response regulator RpfG family c-di-GMP phosphodiesterase
MEKKEVKFEKVDSQKKNTENVQESRKLTYEELEGVCHQLSEQARNLYVKLQEAQNENFFARLNYLFKVIENYSLFEAHNKSEFIESCISEIVELLTIKDENDSEIDNSGELKGV